MGNHFIKELKNIALQKECIFPLIVVSVCSVLNVII